MIIILILRIFETETWLSLEVSSGEVFPPYYNIFRRDKNDGYEAFDHSLDIKEYPLDSEYEVTICSFYRPPNSNIDYM